MSRAAMEQALEALKDALSVCRSVSTCKTRRTREDGVTMYAQTEEWCRWVEGEVGPKVNAAGDALIAALAEQPEQPVAWMVVDEGLYWTEERAIRRAAQFVDALEVLPLYTTPPAPQPLTIERLRDALVASRIVSPAAVEDPDEYDDGLMLSRIEALHRRIMSREAMTLAQAQDLLNDA